MEKKMTKKIVVTAIAKVAEGATLPVEVEGFTVTAEDVLNYANRTIELLDSKAAKAKEKAAEKKEAGDALRTAIKEVLTNEPAYIADIVAKLEDEDATNAKVVTRLSQLVKAGEVIKAPEKVDGRTLMTYRLA